MFRTRGFTLIELLVVIAIIGILSSIVIAGLSGAKASGRDAKRISDIKNIQLALSLYYNDNLHYPCKLDTSGSNGCAPAFVPTYMTTMPKDPSTGADYFYRAFGTTATCSSFNTTIIKYHLLTGLENGTPPDDDVDSVSGTVCSGYASPSGDYTGDAVNCFDSNTKDQCYGVTNN